MFLHLDHIKDIADSCKTAELKKSLRAKIEQYRLDLVQRAYCDTIRKSLDDISSDYIQAIAPHFNGSPPPLHVLQHIKQDIALGRARKRAWHKQSLEDRALEYLKCDDFDPFAITDFVLAKADERRNERAAGMTMTSLNTFAELVKIEFEVGQRVQDGAALLKLLYRVTESRAQDARYEAQIAEQEAIVLQHNTRNPKHAEHVGRMEAQANEKLAYAAQRTAAANALLKQNTEISHAQLLLQGKYYDVKANITRIEKQRDEYVARMQPKKILKP